MNNNICKEFELTAENIDTISCLIVSYCKDNRLDKALTTRYRLAIEECLGFWLNANGEEKKTYVKFEAKRKFVNNYFKLSCRGNRINPYDNSNFSDDFGTSKESILVRTGLIPEYSYRNNINTLSFKVPGKQLNQIYVLLLIILISMIVGILGKLLIPTSVLTFLNEGILSPIESTFFRILQCIAGPMIFLSVAWGVYGIGDVYTLGKIGKKMMLTFLFIVLIFASFGAIFYPFLGPDLQATSSRGNQFSTVFEMILSIFPNNIFSPFVDGNTLQIIFLAFLIGLSLIFLGQRTESVVRAVEQINHIINFLMTFISKLVPFFVSIVLVKIIWSDSLKLFSEVWKFAIVFVIAALSANLLFIIYVAIKNKTSPIFLIKSILPSFLISLTTASSSAAFESNMRICEKDFKISKELSSFGVPFGMVIFKPISAIYFVLVCFYFASVNNIETSISWIATAILISSIAAVAAPPIPGGGTATYTILFLQLGIPTASLAIVLTVDMIFDFLITSGNINILLLELFDLSNKLKMKKN